MLDDAVVPFEVSGIRSANLTRAHFIQHRGMLEVRTISEYERVLHDGGVLLDHRKRKEFIRAELVKAAGALGGTLVSDEELLDTVTFLTESPYIVACRFDKEFLAVPDIVLIEEMKVHQKYFAVRDASGSLMPHFLVVSNNPPTARIREGNERVIAARFTDARFFFQEDRKVSLADKVESLKATLFHKELGSIFDKLGRMQRIGGLIAGDLKLDVPTCKKIDRALYLCKADLNTAMVFEFTSLQGRVGRVYALLDGEDAEVAAAIEDQYRPRFQGDPLPEGMVSIVVSLAEKIDNILGSYSVGNIPKGSQDPYALRRQAGAVVEMLLDSQIGLDLRSLLERCAGNYRNGMELIPKVLEFFSARANTIFTERGLRYDEIDACLSTDYYDYLELYRRAKSINDFRRREGFSEMLLSLKRMNNILSSFRQKNPAYALGFDDSLLSEPAEKELFRFFESRMQDIEGFIKSNSYVDLFALLIEGKPVIDAFFDEVMVMVEDVRVRDNRLAMLESILSHFTGLLNFSKISE
jgi:glycyl-tRNA synthetase beta chain